MISVTIYRGSGIGVGFSLLDCDAAITNLISRRNPQTFVCEKKKQQIRNNGNTILLQKKVHSSVNQ